MNLQQINYKQIKAVLPERYKTRILDTYRWVRAASLYGNTVVCPCCNATLRTFVPGGESPARTALCPRCLSLERHRWLWLYLENQTSMFQAPTRLLHLAPETSLARRFKTMPNIDFVGVDLELTEHVGENVSFQMDITKLAFADDSFDAIICNHVLEHVPDDHNALRELRRVLRPGGCAFITTPVKMDQLTYEDPSITTPAERKKHFEQYDHVRIYGCDIVDRMQEAGFRVKVYSSLEIPEETAQRYGLWRYEYSSVREELIFHCSKNESFNPAL